jgi:8-oxo-dGTP diphosphatase
MGVIVVVLDEVRKQVLLHKREDFRLWALPGGAIEPGETTSQAAIRETQEETGYDVIITRMVGQYSRPQYKDVVYVFEGSVVGGKAIQSGLETAAVAWFNIENIPSRLIPTMKEYIADTIANYPTPIKRDIYFPLWLIILRKIALSLRDARNRLRAKFRAVFR